MSAATASAAATALTAALSALGAAFTAFARHLTLFAAGLEACAWLAATWRTRGVRCRLRSARTDVPVSLVPFVVPVVITTITITITIASVTSASIRASAIAVAAALTAFRPAGLPGVLPSAIATSLAITTRAVRRGSWSGRSRSWRGDLRGRRSFRLAREDLPEPGPNAAVGVRFRRRALRGRRGCRHGRRMRHDRGRRARQQRRDRGDLGRRPLVAGGARLDGLRRGGHEVARLPVLRQVHLIVPDTPDRVLRRLDVGIRHDHELRGAAVLESA